jgi:hypothetical protein
MRMTQCRVDFPDFPLCRASTLRNIVPMPHNVVLVRSSHDQPRGPRMLHSRPIAYRAGHEGFDLLGTGFWDAVGAAPANSG